MTASPADLPTACQHAQQIGMALLLATASHVFVLKVIVAQRGPFSGFAPAVPMQALRIFHFPRLAQWEDWARERPA